MEKMYYSLAEISDMLQIPQHTLRYWEEEIPQLSPRKNARGTRFYTQKDIDTIKQILFLRTEHKLTIQGVKQKLLSSKTEVEKKQQVIERLLELRKKLQGIKNQL